MVEAMNYHDLLVRKPWGYEWQAFGNGHCAIWFLHIASKRKTSKHCHPHKTTALVVLSGSVMVNGIVLKPLERVFFGKGEYHQTEAVGGDIYPSAEDGAIVMELEWPENKIDIIRAEDVYQRVGRGYEGPEHTIPVPSVFALKDGTCRAMGYAFTISEAPSDGAFSLGYGKYLAVTEDDSIKVSDYIADFIARLGIRHVFSVAGGGAMHLVDSFGKHKDVQYVACHHEQAAAMAAEAYGRLHGIGCCLVTTGPGGTNALTGVACAWIDSIPVIFISGQVTQDTLIGGTQLRQFGVQESDIVSLVTPITRYAVTVTSEDNIVNTMNIAARFASIGRPGPVWIDIPLDIQSKRFIPHQPSNSFVEPSGIDVDDMEICLSMLRNSTRPVLIGGNGIHLAGAEESFRRLVKALGIPVVLSWTGRDLLDNDAPLFIGSAGIFGDRASNFAVQNADLLLIIGSRMSIPQVGYNYKTFAREAKIIMVDVDMAEMSKSSLRVDLAIQADAKAFIEAMLEEKYPDTDRAWLDRCLSWKEKYPVINPAEPRNADAKINSYHFIDQLCGLLPTDAVVVTDMGTAFTGTFQSAKIKLGQRWITASGHAPMGYGLPGAIGAAFATGKRVICIVGDGGLQMNVQELATIQHNRLPIIIFVLNNDGYLAIKHTQANHFGRRVGSDTGSGLWCPDTMQVSLAYGIDCLSIQDNEALDRDLVRILEQRGPFVCEIMMPPDQALVPRIASKKLPDGSIRSTALEDLYPFLPRDEFNSQMIVKPVEVLGEDSHHK